MLTSLAVYSLTTLDPVANIFSFIMQ